MPRTGPRTATGKAISRLNAVRHGVLSTTPVVPGLEREEDWQHFRHEMLEGLDPVGAVETALAEQAIAFMWRLQRVQRFEGEAISVYHAGAERELNVALAWSVTPGVEQARIDLEVAVNAAAILRKLRSASMKDGHSLGDATCMLMLTAAVGNSPEAIGDIEGLPSGDAIDDFPYWNAGLLRSALRQIAAREGQTFEGICDVTRAYLEAAIQDRRRTVERLETRLADMQRQRVLPEDRVLHTIIRYEAHLDRGMYRALHELQALQAKRLGEPSSVTRLQVHGLPGA